MSHFSTTVIFSGTIYSTESFNVGLDPRAQHLSTGILNWHATDIDHNSNNMD